MSYQDPMTGALTDVPVWQPPAVDYARWEAKLRALRTKALNGVRGAEQIVKYSSIGLLLLFGFLIVLSFTEFGISGIAMMDWTLAITQSLIPAVVCFFCIRQLVFVPRVLPESYAKAQSELENQWTARLYVDEELLRTLEARLDRAALLNHGVIRKARSFEQQVEFCACHLNSLKRLAQDPEAKLPRREISAAQTVMQLNKLFGTNTGAKIAIGCIALYFFSFLAVIAALYLSSSVRYYIASRAVMLALIDYVLEHPDNTLLALALQIRGKK